MLFKKLLSYSSQNDLQLFDLMIWCAGNLASSGEEIQEMFYEEIDVPTYIDEVLTKQKELKLSSWSKTYASIVQNYCGSKFLMPDIARTCIKIIKVIASDTKSISREYDRNNVLISITLAMKHLANEKDYLEIMCRVEQDEKINLIDIGVEMLTYNDKKDIFLPAI